MTATLGQMPGLARLVLPLCNDALLKAISVHCRQLRELEPTLEEAKAMVGTEQLVDIPGGEADWRPWRGPWQPRCQRTTHRGSSKME